MALNRIKERKEKQKKRIMAIIVAFLMVASGFGVYLSGRGAQQNTVEDTGIKFRIDYDNNQYTAKIGGKEQLFYFLPSSLTNIATNNYADTLRGAPALVMTFNPNTTQDNLQLLDVIRFDIGKSLDKPVINAVTQEHSLYQLPIITCDNATAEMPVLYFVIQENESITKENNCITAQGNMTGLIELRDRIIYDYYGVYEGE